MERNSFVIQILDMADRAIYGASKRGRKTLLYRGFEFWLVRCLKNGCSVWRCNKNVSCKCRARVIAKDLVVVGNKDPQHTHEGNNSHGLAKRAVGEMKRRLEDTLATPAATQAAVAPTLPNHVLTALPKKATLARALRLHRQRTSQDGDGTMPPIPQNREFVMAPRFVPFVQYDSGPGDDRVIIFGCDELLDALARAQM